MNLESNSAYCPFLSNLLLTSSYASTTAVLTHPTVYLLDSLGHLSSESHIYFIFIYLPIFKDLFIWKAELERKEETDQTQKPGTLPMLPKYGNWILALSSSYPTILLYI